MASDALQLGLRITCLPVIHGSGEFALAVRQVMLERTFDCVAVPLPASFQTDVERGIELLPTPTIVTQAEPQRFVTEWSPARDDDSDLDSDPADDEQPAQSYVPI